MLMDVGLSCRIPGDIRDHPIAKWYCLGCHPAQPTFTRNTPFDFTQFVEGLERPQSLLLCKSWIDTDFRARDTLNNLKQLDSCGLLVSSPCLGDSGEALDDRDRYTCGDDIVIPTNEVGSDGTDEQLEAFFNFQSMGPPNLDEGFSFWIVDDKYDGSDRFMCTDAEAEHIMPRCMMTAEQVGTRREHFKNASNAADCVTYLEANFNTATLGDATLHCQVIEQVKNGDLDDDGFTFEDEEDDVDETCFHGDEKWQSSSATATASIMSVATALVLVVASLL
jgi:hypothetical protein